MSVRTRAGARATPLAEPEPGPWPKLRTLRVGRVGAKRAAATLTATGAAFAQTLRRFLDLAHNSNPEYGKAMRRSLIANLAQFRLDHLAADQMIPWLSERDTTMPARLSVGRMRGLLHLGYRLACEYHGPAVADRVPADAVHDAERLPAAREFPPRSLL